MQLTGAQILLETLVEQGVDTMFGYPGGYVMPIYDALYDKTEEIKHILSSDERSAAFAADAYARTTGKTGVVIATSGPGATNLVTGIANAYLDSIPMVAITGNVPRDLFGKDSFQEVDITCLTIPITKHNFLISDISELAETVKTAFTIANSGRKGPVLIDIPKDISLSKAEYKPVGKFEKRPNPKIKEAQIKNAIDIINNAEKPAIYYGGGVLYSEAYKALQQFAEKINAPLITSSMGISAISHDHPLYLGLMGMHGTPVANYAVDNCDLLLTIGARFSDRATGDKSKFAENAKIIHVDIDESEFSKNIVSENIVIGDAKDVLENLLACSEEKTDKKWVEEITEYKNNNPMPRNISLNGEVVVHDMLESIYKNFDEDTIIATDVGQHQMITAQHYPFTKPHSFVSSLGLGAMGYGMGASVGAKVGNPDKDVVLITGDGSFHMNLNEFSVAVTENLPIKIFIMNNGVLGMVRQWQTLFNNKRYSSTTPNRKTDYVKLAEAFGGKGLRITKKEDIDTMVKKAIEIDGPVIVDCVIDKDESVFPIIPPGATLKDAIMGMN